MSTLIAFLLGNGDPVYNVSQSTTTVNEGSSVVFTITTVNVAPSTTLYWSINTISGTVDANDFQGGSTTGSFVTDSNGTGSVSITINSDYTSEGSESFQFQVRTGSVSGTVVATSSTITITDSSVPTYSLTSLLSTNLNEGNSFSFRLDTNGVANGTNLFYTIETVTGNITTSDISSNILSNSFVISGASGAFNTGGSAIIADTIASDFTTEGQESFRINIRTGSISGPIVATSSIVTINDTSVSPNFDLTYYVVAGGGGGGSTYENPPPAGSSGNAASGGGGGGGYLTGSLNVSTNSPYPITIGAGGPGGYTFSWTPGIKGSNSTFGPIVASGGGGGYTQTDPGYYPFLFTMLEGGSGGGGAGGNVLPGGNVAGRSANPPGQGYPGGDGITMPGASTGTPSMPVSGAGGGGGGAGGSGTNATPTAGGSGGQGVYVSLFGTYVSGGGGGASNIYGGSAGSGTNGGGNGGQTTPAGPTGNMNPPTGSAGNGSNTSSYGGGGGGSATAVGNLAPGSNGGGAQGSGGNGGPGIIGLTWPSSYTIAVSPGISYTQPSPTTIIFTSGSGAVTFSQ